MNKLIDKPSAAPANDPLFALRVEERFTMPIGIADDVISKLSLIEQKEARTWVQAIYFDTAEQAMPLGQVVRARRYLTEPCDLQIDGGEYLIDSGNVVYNLKSKQRTKGTLNETADLLNGQTLLRNTEFRPYVGFQFQRHVYSAGDMRVTMDSDIKGFFIDQSCAARPAPMPDLVQLEIKHLPGSDASEDRRIILEAGAVPGVSKHYLLYDKEYEAVKPQMKKILEFPDSEYEAKFETDSTDAFMRFYISIANCDLPGFCLWPLHRYPFTRETINEYRAVPGTDKKVRIMYYGQMKPNFVVKDRGEFTESGILLRVEEKNKLTDAEIAKVMRQPVLGSSRRIKRYLLVLSTMTGKVYSLTTDLSEAPNGRQFYQFEIEYARSERVNEGDPKTEALGEIEQLSNHAQRLGNLRRSRVRKEEWLAQFANPA